VFKYGATERIFAELSRYIRTRTHTETLRKYQRELGISRIQNPAQKRRRGATFDHIASSGCPRPQTQLRATHAPSNIGSRSSQRGNLNIHRLSFGECQLHFNGNLSISRSRRHYDARFIPISHVWTSSSSLSWCYDSTARGICFLKRTGNISENRHHHS
jgi:hypothetical protein